MNTFKVPFLCLVGILSLGLGLGVSVDGSKLKEKISRVARDVCNGECIGDNFDTHAFHCDEDLKECCRVCERGQYKSGNCSHHEGHGEYKYSCSNCKEGYYQTERNIDPDCKECDAPSITCPPGEKIHCNRESGETCQEEISTTPLIGEVTTVPELSTATPEKAANGTKGTPEETGSQEKVTVGEIVGIIIAVLIIVALLILVLIYCYRRWYNNGRSREGYSQELTEEGGGAATTNSVSHNQREANKETEGMLVRTNEETEGMSVRTSGAATTNSVSHNQREANTNSEIQTAGDSDAIAQQADEDDQTSQQDDLHPEDEDDSGDYTLKAGVRFADFKLEVAEQLPPKSRHTFYERLGLKEYEIQNAEHDETGNLYDKKNAVLNKWIQKSGSNDEGRVPELLSAMWKHNLKDTRRKIIEKCCCKRNGVKADNLSSFQV